MTVLHISRKEARNRMVRSSIIIMAVSTLAALSLAMGCAPVPVPGEIAVRAVCGPPWTRDEIDYSGQDFSGQDFSGRHLRNFNFNAATLRQANFANSCFSGGVKFRDVDAEGANYANSAFWADFTQANLQRANFEGAVLGQSFFDRADLRDASLARTSSPTSVFFRNADLRRADLSSSKLLGVFTGADLRSANFRNANLAYSTFESANIENADMRGAIMTERVLAYARAGKAIVDNVKIVPEPVAVTCGTGCSRTAPPRLEK